MRLFCAIAAASLWLLFPLLQLGSTNVAQPVQATQSIPQTENGLESQPAFSGQCLHVTLGKPATPIHSPSFDGSGRFSHGIFTHFGRSRIPFVERPRTVLGLQTFIVRI